jgi:Tfp pilus assembly protein PilV
VKRLLNRDGGFTITEALIAQLVLVIGAVSVWSVFVITGRLNAESEDRTIAANIAQRKMEEIMRMDFDSIAEETVTAFAEKPKSPPYWVLSSTDEWVTSLPEGKYQVSLSPVAGEDPNEIKSVKVTISWRSNTHPNSDASLDLNTVVSK